jgi:hypothetical protein
MRNTLPSGRRRRYDARYHDDKCRARASYIKARITEATQAPGGEVQATA